MSLVTLTSSPCCRRVDRAPSRRSRRHWSRASIASGKDEASADEEVDRWCTHWDACSWVGPVECGLLKVRLPPESDRKADVAGGPSRACQERTYVRIRRRG